MNAYRLTTKALEKMDVLLLQSMIQLVQRQLNTTWTIEESADIFLVDVEQPEGRTFWEARQTDKLIIAYAKQNLYDAKWYLQKPIRVQPLVQLLNDLVAWLENRQTTVPQRTTGTQQRATTVTSTATAAKTSVSSGKTLEATTIFQPSQYLIGLVQAAMQARQVKQFRYADTPPVFLLPQERRCFTVTIPMTHVDSSLKSLYSVPAEHIRQEDLTLTELQARVEKSALREYSLETILWKNALTASQGRMWMETGFKLTKDTLVRLTRWPNFASLPHLPAHINLAAFMLKKTADLPTIAFKTQTPLPVVIDFFNACKVIDLVIETGSGEPMVEREVTESKRDLFRSILRRLGK